MATCSIEESVLAALEAKAPAEGLDVVSVEVGGPTVHPTLRVRIDTLDDAAIDMERVAAATPWVSSVVEELDPFPGAWELEVSSPGIDRPLRRKDHFESCVGERVEVSAREAIDGRRSWVGELVAVSDDSVTVRVDGTDCEIAFASIKQAKLKPDFDKILAAAKKAEKEAKSSKSSPAFDSCEEA